MREIIYNFYAIIHCYELYINKMRSFRVSIKNFIYALFFAVTILFIVACDHDKDIEKYNLNGDAIKGVVYSGGVKVYEADTDTLLAEGAIEDGKYLIEDIYYKGLVKIVGYADEQLDEASGVRTTLSPQLIESKVVYIDKDNNNVLLTFDGLMSSLIDDFSSVSQDDIDSFYESVAYTLGGLDKKPTDMSFTPLKIGDDLSAIGKDEAKYALLMATISNEADITADQSSLDNARALDSAKKTVAEFFIKGDTTGLMDKFRQTALDMNLTGLDTILGDLNTTVEAKDDLANDVNVTDPGLSDKTGVEPGTIADIGVPIDVNPPDSWDTSSQLSSAFQGRLSNVVFANVENGYLSKDDGQTWKRTVKLTKKSKLKVRYEASGEYNTTVPLKVYILNKVFKSNITTSAPPAGYTDGASNFLDGSSTDLAKEDLAKVTDKKKATYLVTQAVENLINSLDKAKRDALKISDYYTFTNFYDFVYKKGMVDDFSQIDSILDIYGVLGITLSDDVRDQMFSVLKEKELRDIDSIDELRALVNTFVQLEDFTKNSGSYTYWA